MDVRVFDSLIREVRGLEPLIPCMPCGATSSSNNHWARYPVFGRARPAETLMVPHGGERQLLTELLTLSEASKRGSFL
jgi:hypothetical protein